MTERGAPTGENKNTPINTRKSSVWGTQGNRQKKKKREDAAHRGRLDGARNRLRKKGISKELCSIRREAKVIKRISPEKRRLAAGQNEGRPRKEENRGAAKKNPPSRNAYTKKKKKKKKKKKPKKKKTKRKHTTREWNRHYQASTETSSSLAPKKEDPPEYEKEEKGSRQVGRGENLCAC